jgi:hypothetical protein
MDSVGRWTTAAQPFSQEIPLEIFYFMGDTARAGHASTLVQYLPRNSSGTTGLGAPYRTGWAPIDRGKRLTAIAVVENNLAHA